MEFKDYYKTLGVPRDADQEAIKSRFRELARRYHPDVNSSDKKAESLFKEVSEAYEVLGDSEKRARYDALAADRVTSRSNFDWSSNFVRSNGNSRGGFRGGFDDAGADSFSDFFHFIFERENEFGKGRDLRAELPVTLEQIHRGEEVMIAHNGDKLKVKIPAGIRDGAVLRIAGRGEPGPDSSHGDLLLHVRESPHNVFRRKDNDLYCDVSTDLYTALLGGSVVLKTLDGQVELKIPAESHPGSRLRLRGHGMAIGSSGSRGDLFVVLNVEFPKKLNDEEKKLLRRLSELR